MNSILTELLSFLSGQRNRIFWALFIILGVFVIGGIFINLFFIDIILGILMIIIGLQRIEDEHYKEKLEKERRKTNDALNYMAQWLDASHDYITRTKNKHENRLFNLDRKKASLDSRMEMNHRDVVKKIIELENRFNELTMSYARGQKLRSGRRRNV